MREKNITTFCPLPACLPACLTRSAPFRYAHPSLKNSTNAKHAAKRVVTHAALKVTGSKRQELQYAERNVERGIDSTSNHPLEQKRYREEKRRNGTPTTSQELHGPQKAGTASTEVLKSLFSSLLRMLPLLLLLLCELLLAILHGRPLIHPPKGPLSDLVAANHDGTRRRHLKRAGNPPPEETGHAFRGENMPQQSRHVPLLRPCGTLLHRRDSSLRCGAGFTVNLCPRLADVERHGCHTGKGSGKRAGDEAVGESFGVVFPRLGPSAGSVAIFGIKVESPPTSPIPSLTCIRQFSSYRLVSPPVHAREGHVSPKCECQPPPE